MIKSVHIKNFKSVVDLKLELGRFNVFIGENGCGKSNILEALAFGAAASADKLDFEFLGSRGIRVTNPEFMFSAFEGLSAKKVIETNFIAGENNKQFPYKLKNDPNNAKHWTDEYRKNAKLTLNLFLKNVILEKNSTKRDNFLNKNKINKNDPDLKVLENIINLVGKDVGEKVFMEQFTRGFLSESVQSDLISEFIIYSPEQSSLRKFEDTTQIYPLGIKGEGIFQYLKELAQNKKNTKLLNSIKDNLVLLDWFENFELPKKLLSNEFSLNIRDRYLNKKLQYFDQRSTNEGFLYLLFYSTLFISPTTPPFFAVDNIDTSFNPKLCKELTKNLVTLATKHKKQAIVTTHNPAILDGLNLKDDEQRLFVIRRNSQGHTIAERIMHNPERTMKLSDLWTSGIIGGLPDNF